MSERKTSAEHGAHFLNRVVQPHFRLHQWDTWTQRNLRGKSAEGVKLLKQILDSQNGYNQPPLACGIKPTEACNWAAYRRLMDGKSEYKRQFCAKAVGGEEIRGNVLNYVKSDEVHSGACMYV